MAVQKKKRAHKVSLGIHGAKKHPLTEGQKVLLGKGLFQSFAPIGSWKSHKRGNN